MNDIRELTQYPICDTDIWVKISLGNLYEKLFNKYKIILVADVVEGEILMWNRNPNSKFKFIAEKYLYYKEIGKIRVINHEEDIPIEDRRLLEQQLYDFDFENDFNNRPKEDNKGEFVSAIYADYFGISLMKSNDHEFGENGRGRIAFPDLEVKNWYITTEELIKDSKERIKIRSEVDKRSNKMEQEFNIFKQNKEDLTDDLLNKKINQLMNKYSKR